MGTSVPAKYPSPPPLRLFIRPIVPHPRVWPPVLRLSFLFKTFHLLVYSSAYTRCRSDMAFVGVADRLSTPIMVARPSQLLYIFAPILSESGHYVLVL